jgi:sugar (pentulose or hexulose) kinase
MLLLGIDIGTESVRAGLVKPDGTVVATAHESYVTRYPQPQWAEQDPED